MNKLELMKTANQVRKDAVTAVYCAKSGHPGGSLSAADIYTYLFFEEIYFLYSFQMFHNCLYLYNYIHLY